MRTTFSIGLFLFGVLLMIGGLAGPGLLCIAVGFLIGISGSSPTTTQGAAGIQQPGVPLHAPGETPETSAPRPAPPRLTVTAGPASEPEAAAVAALRAEVKILAKRQSNLERSPALRKATARIQQLEDEVQDLRSRLALPGAPAPPRAALTGDRSAMSTEPSHAAVESLARFLDPS